MPEELSLPIGTNLVRVDELRDSSWVKKMRKVKVQHRYA